jgi:hypothetical protein
MNGVYTATSAFTVFICEILKTKRCDLISVHLPFIKDINQERSINHHDKLGNHSNPILQPLLEQQQRRRLKKLWPADLTDG